MDIVAVVWVASLIAGTICFGAGLLALLSNPKSRAALIFLFAMWGTFVALITGAMFPLIDPAEVELSATVGLTYVFSGLLAETFLWQLTLTFPVERRISVFPLNRLGAVMVAGVVAVCVLGSMVEVEAGGETNELSAFGARLLVLYPAAMIVIAMVIIVASQRQANEVQRRSGIIYLAGLWIFALGGVPYMMEMSGGGVMMIGDVSLSALAVVLGIGVSGLVFASSIAMGRMVMMEPTPEVTASSSKSSFNLLHRRVYLVEEEKPQLSFEIFSDVLRGRCFDCENDESFPCESLDCASCSLPCPCRDCSKYRSRSQGLIITRQFPNEVRTAFYLQTTPIIWLSTVAGKDNIDPAKLSLLTDMLANFMERSQNGVVLVDGLEYLVTSTDFPRVLKAVDRWTEVAMTSSTRLILSIDPRAFDARELALLEKNKEVVTMDRTHTIVA